MTHLVWAIWTPFLGAMVCLLLRGRAVAWAGLAASLAVFGVCINLVMSVWEHGFVRVELGGWAAPLGIGLYLDGIGALFMLLTAMVGVLVGVYAMSFFGHDSPDHPDRRHGQGRMRPYFWPIWLLLWGGLNGLYLSSDIFNAYVLLEIVGIAAVGLTVLSGTRASLTAGLRYLLATMFASLMYLLGVALLYAQIGRLDFFLLAETMTPSLPVLAAFGLMTFGLLIKGALLPFHFWLPPAHSSAPAPVSAILSAMVTKAAFFLLLRIWFVIFPEILVPATGQLIGLMGAVAVLWGSLQAVRQTSLKMLIAYSTVGQLGYLFLLFALIPGGTHGSEAWASIAWTGMMFHVFSHGLAKAALFLAAGCLVLAMGTDDLRAMRDIAGRLPVITFTLAVAGVSLMGLPPSAGFVAKWMLLKASLASGQWWWVVVIALGGLLTASYVFKILSFTFVPSTSRPMDLKPVPMVMTLVALTLAVLCALFGFRAEEVIAMLPQGVDMAFPDIPGGRP
ncbi:multisubunit sodium/proton antiporter, MrpD subunit [Desulfonatronum thiosulfatophilum]|uniref:Multisubunit sodium/proton antiporter, MrpD subunit n=1 Tax=Desulfonatronum thiosulfatophilum TaxID=617002 RepID=A0A1G6ENW2_9BACT|nr:proton-conducting transporter membrane subunit [Desulfonatronum thiosulfatophilum]SDB59213.1 multisubunit sodium/proton antiporter, MrpD subunit [Desulfonatronum thiosulfatophilum]